MEAFEVFRRLPLETMRCVDDVRELVGEESRRL